MGCYEVVSDLWRSNNQRVESLYQRLGKLNIKKNRQLSHTMFLTKYVMIICSSLIMENFNLMKRWMEFNWNSWWTQWFNIWLWYFCINEDLSDIIQSTHQENNMLSKIISNEDSKNDSQFDSAEICDLHE